MVASHVLSVKSNVLREVDPKRTLKEGGRSTFLGFLGAPPIHCGSLMSLPERFGLGPGVFDHVDSSAKSNSPRPQTPSLTTLRAMPARR
jgi:hypothetical protein